MLNDKQNYALAQMKTGHNIFLTGAGGVGKTFLIKTFVEWAMENKFKLSQEPVAITSLTGASALLIGGSTIHSFAGIGLGNGSVSELMTKITKNFFIKRRWMRTKVLIIDEISMMKPDLFEKLEEIARLIKKNSRVFGGIQIILSGDFAQLCPVKMTKYCFESEMWNKVVDESIYLKEIVRQKDVKFQNCLNELRLGECSPETEAFMQSRVGVKLENEFNIIPTKLYATNRKVDAINAKYLKELIEAGNESMTFALKMNTTGTIPKNLQPLVEKLINDCPADPNLTLAVGSQVMVITNISEKKLVNGSRGRLVEFKNEIPMVQFLDGRTLSMGFHEWDKDLTEKIKVSLKQIPLKLANSWTIHKSQGQSIDYVETSIDDSIFENGQGYTAVSRAETAEGMTLEKFVKEVIKCHPAVKKFYQDLENAQTKTIGDFFFSPSPS